MANLALRNPQFKSVVLTATANSAVCSVIINNVLRYTLTKNRPSSGGLVASNITLNFDIAELARDYLEITYQINYIPQTVDIETEIITYTLPNGQGSIVDRNDSVTDRGFEAYGEFIEGVNPEVPFRNAPTYLIAGSGKGGFNILAPYNTTGILPSITSLNSLIATSYSSTDTSVTTVDGIVCDIKRIDCTKYGIGNKIIFINKYGAQQNLWFFLKESKNIARTNEGYKSNTITYPTAGATYSIEDAPNKVFNTQAKRTHTLSSGYYPEFANQFFEELLLSEYVWLSIRGDIIPVKVKTSSMAFKTSVNDRLIEYTIEFEEAFDYINNIR